MQKNWTTEQLIIALYWYCTKIPFTKIKYTKAQVIELANLVGRTPSAAAFKLVNFARLDPALQARGVKGMSKGSKAEKPIWDKFYGNWDRLAIAAEELIAQMKNIPLESVSQINTEDLPRSGKERVAMIKVRVNQAFFRNTVLLSYQNQCCITGIKTPELLVASHIVPWAKNLSTAANPENGLCLNVLHDKAFDKGLLTITEDYRIKLSKKIMKEKSNDFIQKFFLSYKDKEIIMPNRFIPNQEFLNYHRENIFIS